MNNDSIVITGIGLLTSAGFGKEETWRALAEGRSGIRVITRFDPVNRATKIGGQLDDDRLNRECEELFGRKFLRRTELVSRAGTLSTHYALKDSGLDLDAVDPETVGISFGNADGNRGYTEENIHAWFRASSPGKPIVFPMEKIAVLKFMQSSVAANIAIQFNLQGPAQMVNSSCSAGLSALQVACHQIESGLADIMIAGGAEIFIVEQTIAAFNELGILTTRNDLVGKALRPFERDRAGTLLSDGAAALVLEKESAARKRGAHIYGRITGYSSVSEAHSLLAPDTSGRGIARAMESALRRARTSPAEIDFISAHGTSTVVSDRTETAAIKRVFGERAGFIPINAIKSMIGHSIGASGAIQVGATLLSMDRECIPPTINYDNPDLDCDLFYTPNEAVQHTVRKAVVNTAGFGGYNCAVVLETVE